MTELLTAAKALLEGYAADPYNPAGLREFAALRGIQVGDHVSPLNVRAKSFGPYTFGEVVKVNTKTFTIRAFYDGAEFYVPLDLGYEELRPNFQQLLEAAQALVAEAAPEPVVVIPCGGNKAAGPAPIVDLYVGTYFRAMLAAARALTPDDHIFILSGRYGFVPITDPRPFATYEQRITDDNAVTPEELRTDVGALPLLAQAAAGKVPVTILAGSAYAERATTALGPQAAVELPLAGSRGIGDHLARASAIVTTRRAA